MTPKELLTAIRRYANIPKNDGRAPNSMLMQFANAGKDFIAKRMIQQDQKHFEVNDTVDLVALQQEYDLPFPVKDQRITLVERLNAAGEVVARLTYRRFQEKSLALDPEWPGEVRSEHYYLRGRKIGLHRVPTESLTAGLRVYGIQHPHDMLWGKVPSSGLTTTAFVIPRTPVNESGDLLAGLCHTEPSYYVNAKGRVITGNARGTEFTVTAFSAATQTATITPAWTTADVTGQEFVILCAVPDDYHEAIVGYALRALSVPAKDQNLYRIGTEMFGEWATLIQNDVVPRTMDESQSMPIPDDDLMDS